MWGHHVLNLTKYFESWVFFNLPTQVMLRLIWLLFQGILVHYHNTFRRYIWIFVHSPLLGSDLWVTTLIGRVLSCFGLVKHAGCPWWLVTSLLYVACLITGHLGDCPRWHTLVRIDVVLETHHILLHVGRSLGLTHDTAIVLRTFRQVGEATHSYVSHVLGWTRLEPFNGALQRLASLLNSWFTIGFHQRRQPLIIEAGCILRWLYYLQQMHLVLWWSLRPLGKLYFAWGYLQDWCLFDRWNHVHLFAVLH